MMGTVIHEAVLVTSWDEIALQKAHDTASHMFEARVLSAILPPVVNQYRTFLIQTSGSKKGWEESAEHAQQIDAFLTWLKTLEYEDGSSPIEWVRVFYGSDLDEQPARAVRG